jgi:hypothetical protein
VVFPEVDADVVEHIQGMNITISVGGGRDDISRRLLAGLGMPFKRPEPEPGHGHEQEQAPEQEQAQAHEQEGKE